MTIYATPFRQSDKKTTGPSVDSGFKDLDAVVDAMGWSPYRNSRMIIHGGGEDRVVFSDFIFCIDGEVTTA